MDATVSRASEHVCMNMYVIVSLEPVNNVEAIWMVLCPLSQ